MNPSRTPLIHCITNYVTACDVANTILAVGGSPIMADHPEEAAVITSRSDGLLLNMGTPNQSTKAVMIQTGKKANQIGIPVLFDPVGISVSPLRTKLALSLIRDVKMTLIRGNASELKALLRLLTEDGETSPTASQKHQGVDVSVHDRISSQTIDAYLETTKALSAMTGAVVVMTGSIDIISTWKESRLVYNGCSQMSQITGSGCMLDGALTVTAAKIASSHSSEDAQKELMEATAYTVSRYGLCGEQAAKKMKENDLGTGSFRCYFLDALSQGEEAHFQRGALKIEIS
ncbi:hydroxyethylthiazole kinase [Clostridium sp. E02]|uniref:hydroxyethylthiazole kinase n=1 Tax=Clostridium sp. E02 TaxID=2487134 RepID=UPI000F53646E|nr:hydroxyethylthiazole kinase [Clostridium sp. E02]